MTPANIANAKREERNRQQRKRRAEMTDEQREESNRKQREYRARRKAASQNISTASIVSQVLSTSSPVGAYNILDICISSTF